MNKHTPGPWFINRNSYDCAENKISIEVEGDYFIAQVDEGMHQEANAQLIAAAPELLKALEWLVFCWVDSATIAPVTFKQAIDSARAAITKATQPITKE